VNDNDGRFDLAQLRAEMSPIGQEALDAAVARLLLKQAQDRISQLERQKSPAAQPHNERA
jgi:hypothetical protein